MKSIFVLSFLFYSVSVFGQAQPEKTYKSLQKFAQENQKGMMESFVYQRLDEGDEFDEEMAEFFLKLSTMSYSEYLAEIDIPSNEKETISVMIELTQTMIQYFLIYPLLHENPDEALNQLMPLLQRIEELTLKIDSIQGMD